MRPIRATVDTNVAVSAALKGGRPGEVMRAWADGELILCVSRPIVAEYRRAFARADCLSEFADIERRINDRQHCEMAEKTGSLRVVSDPDDNKFVECAVALGAEFIVSGDKALLRLGRYESVDILNPVGFLNKIRARKQEQAGV